MKKRTGCLLIALGLTLGLSMTAWAENTKIEMVDITLSQEQEPVSGESIGRVSAETGSDQYRISDVYYTTEEEVWTLGDTPQVKVILNAASGYRFAYTAKSHFTITGCDAKYKKAKYYDDYTTMELTVTLPQIKGKLAFVENAYWEDGVAVWDELVGAKRYDVWLYRNEKIVAKVSTENTSYDFSDYYTKEGDYMFKVRGIARFDNRAGEWSETSDFNLITESQAQTAVKGEWVQDEKGRWYRYANGGYPAGDWRLIDSAWYYFDRSGYAVTGWQKVGDSWYYLDTASVMATGWQKIGNDWYYLDGSGAMQTGWHEINGKWYYMNKTGVMQTGWQNIDQKWYCMDDSGAMYADTRTPDGYTVDSKGVYWP